MNNRRIYNIIDKFNRGIHLNERSLIQQVSIAEESNRQQLELKVNQNVELVKTFKGLSIIMDCEWLKLNDPMKAVQKLQILYDFKAQYGFNCNNELFYSYLTNVCRYNLWNESFDEWLARYVKMNVCKFTYLSSFEISQQIRSHGLKSSNEVLPLMDEQMMKLNKFAHYLY